MTRKEYAALAEVLRNEYSRTDHTLAQLTLMQRLIPEIGAAIARAGGLDRNGNRRFTTERFCLDAGMEDAIAARLHGQDPMWNGETANKAYKSPTWTDMLGDSLPGDAHKR